MDARIRANFEQLDSRLQNGSRKLQLWWRDDDFDSSGAGLDALKRVAAETGIVPLIAAIPDRISATKLRQLDLPADWFFCQHGYRHRSYEKEGQPHNEFGEARGADEVRNDLLKGRERLRSLFGSQYLDVMVPPWSKFAVSHERIISELCYKGFSSSGLAKRADISPTIVQENVHLDLLRWGSTDGPTAAPWERVMDRLEQCLVGLASQSTVRLGILTHHKAMKEDAFELLQNFILTTSSMRAVAWLSASHLFGDV